MTALRVLPIVLVASWGLAGIAAADVAYPARLLIQETSPGTYDVTFTLPIVEGRKLRAEPLLPPTCHELTEREIGISAVGYTSTWTVACDPASLAGEAVLIDGLLGTQTELAFTLSTLSGRVHTGILRPSRPGFLVPPPPSRLTLAAKAVAEGVRRVLRQGPIWLLLLVAVAGGVRWRAVGAAAAAFAGGHAVAQWLGGNGWLLVTPLARDGFVLASAAVPAVALAGGGDRWRGWLEPLWPLLLLVGLLAGGADPESLPADGLSAGEQSLALVAFAVGSVGGLLLIATAAMELRAVVTLLGGGRWRTTVNRVIGYVVGAVAVGMVMASAVAVALVASDLLRSPLELALLALVLGPTLAFVGLGGPGALIPFAGLVSLGLVPGLSGVRLPADGVWVIGALLLLAGAFTAGRQLPRRWALPVGAVAASLGGWSMGSELLESVSRSTGAALGAVLVASCILFGALALGRTIGRPPAPTGLRMAGAVVLATAAWWRIAEYREWFDNRVATEAALGLIRIPVLAAMLLLAALLAWPRSRAVLRELGVEQVPRTAHWLLLGAAFLAVPFGTLAVRNPVFTATAPRGDSARRVMSNVLSETYRAFNLVDENALYERLSNNVAGELVDDLYLDSRRRLTAGTREGAEVTVRDVSVVEIGEPRNLDQTGADFAYDCRWVVTARVRHLQHVHHRQNIYNGVLTLRIEGDRWKIAGVELESEDRVVVPWRPT